MKTSTTLAGALALLALSGCLPASIRSLDPLPPDVADLRTDFRVAVLADADAQYQASEYELGRLAADLRATGVFASVEVGERGGADLIVLARSAHSGPYCGNPLLLTMFTAGVVPATLPRYVAYDFSFASASGAAEPVPLRPRYSTKEKYGLIAVPMRLSKKWSRSPDDRTPRIFIAALKAEILAEIDRLRALASGTEVAQAE